MHKAGWKQLGVTFPRAASALAVATMLACSGGSGLAEELRVEQSTVETRVGTGKWAERRKDVLDVRSRRNQGHDRR